MSRHAAIVIEGVLRDPLNGQPAEDGRSIYHALANNYRLTLITDEERDKVEHWLKVEGFHRHTNLSVREHGSRTTQIQLLRATGPLDLVITSEPHLAHELFGIGQPALIYINPRQYTRLPTRQEWGDLVARIDEDRTRAALTLQEAEDI